MLLMEKRRFVWGKNAMQHQTIYIAWIFSKNGKPNPALKLDSHERHTEDEIISTVWYWMMICILNTNNLCEMFEQHVRAYRLKCVQKRRVQTMQYLWALLRRLVIQFLISAIEFYKKFIDPNKQQYSKNQYWLPIYAKLHHWCSFMIQRHFFREKQSSKDVDKTLRILQKYVNFWTQDHKVINRHSAPAFQTSVFIAVNEMPTADLVGCNEKQCSYGVCSASCCMFRVQKCKMNEKRCLLSWAAAADFMQNHTLVNARRHTFMVTSATLSETHDQLQRIFAFIICVKKTDWFCLDGIQHALGIRCAEKVTIK